MILFRILASDSSPLGRKKRWLKKIGLSCLLSFPETELQILSHNQVDLTAYNITVFQNAWKAYCIIHSCHTLPPRVLMLKKCSGTNRAVRWVGFFYLITTTNVTTHKVPLPPYWHYPHPVSIFLGKWLPS